MNASHQLYPAAAALPPNDSDPSPMSKSWWRLRVARAGLGRGHSFPHFHVL